MIDNIIVMIKLTANKEHWTRNSYFQELDIDQKELNLDERRLLTVRTLNFWHILVDLSVTAYVLFLKLFKDCSDISIFWQEKTTCYFKKSSCYDALFTDCRTFRDRLDKRGRYKVRISETERHERHGASMRDILKFTPRTPRTPRCLACYQTQISGSWTKILSLSTLPFSAFRVKLNC